MYCGRDFRFANWTERRYAEGTHFNFHVPMRIEGLLAHCFFEEITAQIIGKRSVIHYVEEHSRRRERTRTYDPLVWCKNPS